MLDLYSEYIYMKEEIDAAIQKCLKHQQWILGPEVNELEEKISQYLGVKHCIGVSSGTDALILSLRALAIKFKGQEYFNKADCLITTPFSFVATGDTIIRSGATPIFVDIDPKTYNIDPENIEMYLLNHRSSITEIVGIVIVNLYGLPCNMNKIMYIAKEYNLFVIEDCAQSFGAKWNGKYTGTFGDAGCFSFFPSKNLGGFGDGGMISTDDNEIAEIVRMLIKHGGKDKYNVEHIGYNARLDTIQAAVLLAKFKYFEEFTERRRSIAEIYNKELSSINELILPYYNFPSSIMNCYHVYNQYTIRLRNNKRDKLQQYLKNKGINTMVYYPVPLHRMKLFEGRCKLSGVLKNAEEACKSVLSLPIEPLMRDYEIEYVIDGIKDFFKKR